MPLIQTKHASGIMVSTQNIADGPADVIDSQSGTWANVAWVWNTDTASQVHRRHGAAAGAMTVTVGDIPITFDSPVQDGSTIIVLLGGKVFASFPNSDVQITIVEWSGIEFDIATDESWWTATFIPSSSSTFEPLYAPLPTPLDGVMFASVWNRAGTVTSHPTGFTQLAGNTANFYAYYREVTTADTVTTAALGGSTTSRWATVVASFHATESPVIGSSVFGVTTTVTSTCSVAFGLDGETNTLSDAGTLKIFGDLEVTGTVTIPGASLSNPASILNAIVGTDDGQPIIDSDGNVVYVNG
jgi:hypothetical protein